MTEDFATLLSNDTFRHMIWTVIILWGLRALIRAVNNH